MALACGFFCEARSLLSVPGWTPLPRNKQTFTRPPPALHALHSVSVADAVRQNPDQQAAAQRARGDGGQEGWARAGRGMARAAGSTDRGVDGPSPAVGELGGRVAAATLEEEEGDPWRDWAGGVPQEVLAMIGEALVAQKEAAWAAELKMNGFNEGYINERLEERKSEGRCLFVFARVCKPWRKAQLKVGGPLRTRVGSDVIPPGNVELAKWALAEGCPRRGDGDYTMAHFAASYGHLELVQWLCVAGGFAMDEYVMDEAAAGGNLELVQWLRASGCPGWTSRTCASAAFRGHLELLQWLRANGCPWDKQTTESCVQGGHVEVLRWARENGCAWRTWVRDRAEKLGYIDDVGNLVP